MKSPLACLLTQALPSSRPLQRRHSFGGQIDVCFGFYCIQDFDDPRMSECPHFANGIAREGQPRPFCSHIEREYAAIRPVILLKKPPSVRIEYYALGYTHSLRAIVQGPDRLVKCQSVTKLVRERGFFRDGGSNGGFQKIHSERPGMRQIQKEEPSKGIEEEDLICRLFWVATAAYDVYGRALIASKIQFVLVHCPFIKCIDQSTLHRIGHSVATLT